MRLLHSGSLELCQFEQNATPPYAILSHTWGVEEVTLDDLGSPEIFKKDGFSKIRHCAAQAKQDGLDYFWIDTCCIDRKSSAELTEAINSMFRWYQEAIVCYVYLADVSTTVISEPQFLQSRWFNRGWTLQELIAPRNIKFYTRNWYLIGSKSELVDVISKVTSIPIEVLKQSKRPDEYSMSERMAWASYRETTRMEDKAYSLMGLFGINMPMLYGEGEGAFQRLQKEIMGLANQSSGLRLLVVNSNPLTIETFSPQEAPPYAILSHTWSTGEVSFQDVLVGKAPDRKGYKKIKGCCVQAAIDGYNYLWVDTCCIDKTSSAELQEAICSMYKWYKDAHVCYAYLEDYDWSNHANRSRLSSCKWFKRGWTLQELIAPHTVKFFDSRWVEFGRKDNLYQQISEITGIDPTVLRGADPTKLTVAERMSWASGRLTSRIEDIAYSLMGLFNVFMPMLYGEGNRAFIRLQEEIMKQSEDYTIFAWKSHSLDPGKRGILAHSPSEFASSFHTDEWRHCSQVITEYWTPDRHLHVPAALTSRGLLIGLPLLKQDLLGNDVSDLSDLSIAAAVTSSSSSSDLGPGFHGTLPTVDVNVMFKSGTYLALICRSTPRNDRNSFILCIWLQNQENNRVFRRLWPQKVVLLPSDRSSDFRLHTIYILPSGTEY